MTKDWDNPRPNDDNFPIEIARIQMSKWDHPWKDDISPRPFQIVTGANIPLIGDRVVTLAMTKDRTPGTINLVLVSSIGVREDEKLHMPILDSSLTPFCHFVINATHGIIAVMTEAERVA